MASGGLKVGTCPTGVLRNILFSSALSFCYFFLFFLFWYFVILIWLLNIHAVFCPWQPRHLLGFLSVWRRLAILSVCLFLSPRVCLRQTFSLAISCVRVRICRLRSISSCFVWCETLVMWKAAEKNNALMSMWMYKYMHTDACVCVYIYYIRTHIYMHIYVSVFVWCVYTYIHTIWGMMGSKEWGEKSSCSLEMTSCSSLPLSGFPRGPFSFFCLSLTRNPSPLLTRRALKAICTHDDASASSTESLPLPPFFFFCHLSSSFASVSHVEFGTPTFLIRYFNVWWFPAPKDLHQPFSLALARAHARTPST